MPDPITYTDLTIRITKVFTLLRTQTGMEPNFAFLQVQLHPSDLANLRMTLPFPELNSMLDKNMLIGLKLVADLEREIGCPQLVSTWRAAL